MKLTRLKIERYRSIRSDAIELGGVNLFIGGNAVGKSTILDALRFLHAGVRAGDFKAAVAGRGGIAHLGWKGKGASDIRLEARIEDGRTSFEWTVSLIRENHAFHVAEQVAQFHGAEPPITLLEANGGGWWRSGGKGKRVSMRVEPRSGG